MLNSRGMRKRRIVKKREKYNDMIIWNFSIYWDMCMVYREIIEIGLIKWFYFVL